MPFYIDQDKEEFVIENIQGWYLPEDMAFFNDSTIKDAITGCEGQPDAPIRPGGDGGPHAGLPLGNGALHRPGRNLQPGHQELSTEQGELANVHIISM
jgi:hypothetical protein